MKTSTYILRPVTDINDIVLYYEFVRKEDDAILRASACLLSTSDVTKKKTGEILGVLRFFKKKQTHCTIYQ